jgi:molybdopterin molybdotransferase
MISFEEARNIVLNSVSTLDTVQVPILDALGLVAAEDIVSSERIPPFDNSAMDGYAVRAEDIAGASEENPAELKVLMDLPAGQYTDTVVGQGEAIRIMTGAPVPSGADTIVQVELTARTDGGVKILEEHEADRNIRRAGEDIAIGQSVLEVGQEITPAKIGVLASVGRAKIDVVRRPVVAVLATGDELLDAGEPLEPGKIRSSNSYTLSSQVRACGAEPKYLGIARDTMDDVREHFRKGLSADMIISSAGVSVGDYDYVRDALEELGVEFKFTKVAIKPGKPTVFGLLGDGKPVFGLPGNPVSSMMTFEQFARPAILKMMGRRRLLRPVVDAILEEDIKKKAGRMSLVRAVARREGNDYYVTTTGPQGSGILVSMDHANAIILFMPGTERLKKGESVKVQLLDMPEVE